MSETCGQCRFFVRWERKETYSSGTYCGWKPPRVAGIDTWGKPKPDCRANFEACSMFEPSTNDVGASGPRRVRIEE